MWVVRSFLLVREGRACSERALRESERLLRAQPFLSDASVVAIPDGSGGVRIDVTTTDEVPALVSGRIRGLRPIAASLGNANIGGMGLRADAGIARGYGFRPLVMGQLNALAIGGRPYAATVAGTREPLGGSVLVEMRYPFLSDLQNGSWRVSQRVSTAWMGIRRPARDAVSLPVDDRWSEASLIRRTLSGPGVLLTGLSAGRRVIMPGSRAFVIANGQLLADTGITLRDRYIESRASHVGGLIGVRAARFITVSGFDALAAPQDVMRGLAHGVLVAAGIGDGSSGLVVSSNTYAGVATPHSLIAASVDVQGREPRSTGTWSSVVAGGRVAAYLGGAPGGTLVIGNETSIAARSTFPIQFSLADASGGVRGYRSSMLSGARRNVTRVDARWAWPKSVFRADAGVGVFADYGRLWAGDAPYGVDATRQSVGVSLLSAYPSRSKRTYRIDVSFPVQRDPGMRRVEFTITSEDRTGRFWKEPGDLRAARLMSSVSDLFGW